MSAAILEGLLIYDSWFSDHLNLSVRVQNLTVLQLHNIHQIWTPDGLILYEFDCRTAA